MKCKFAVAFRQSSARCGIDSPCLSVTCPPALPGCQNSGNKSENSPPVTSDENTSHLNGSSPASPHPTFARRILSCLAPLALLVPFLLLADLLLNPWKIAN